MSGFARVPGRVGAALPTAPSRPLSRRGGADVGLRVARAVPTGRRRWSRRHWLPIGLAMLLGWCLLPRVSAQVADAIDLGPATRLLDRMNGALRSLDYQGTLVYLIDNRLETLHLVHRIEHGRVQERLVSMSGPLRSVTRERDRVTCVMPNGHPILVKSQSRRAFMQPEPIDPRALSDRYRTELLDSARVAGRETDVVAIRPLDEVRYGYQFYLDRATGLPLKSDLIDHRGEAIEQLLFTSIELSGTTAASPASADAPPPVFAAPPTDPLPTSWRFDPRPAGFELTMHDVMEGPQGAQIDHFVFSDRLSSYSVYIEGNAMDGFDGVTRIGAVHAAGRVVDGHQVIAVGEVPAGTVAAAVSGVRSAGDATP
ncbi:MucB/RseB C-terminal domain-containing protein [Lamprocystis purpurea]|uniref:MucB/RseB C-terminal domain-containing protein n=1 Tax=Lamprocystis purpurea TaxID=61598 RepID=UPI00146E7F84|nr:MucB/RseB C-terminal domain-containing protein [Lamprocystis purpurea]